MRTFQHFLSGTEGEWPEQIYDTATGNWVVDREKLLEVLNFVNDAFNTYQVTQTPAQASDLSMGDQIVSDYMQNNKMVFISQVPGRWDSSRRGALSPGRRQRNIGDRQRFLPITDRLPA